MWLTDVRKVYSKEDVNLCNVLPSPAYLKGPAIENRAIGSLCGRPNRAVHEPNPRTERFHVRATSRAFASEGRMAQRSSEMSRTGEKRGVDTAPPQTLVNRLENSGGITEGVNHRPT